MKKKGKDSKDSKKPKNKKKCCHAKKNDKDKKGGKIN